MGTGGNFRSMTYSVAKKIFVSTIVFNLIFSSVAFSQSTPKQVEVVFCMDLSASTNGILDRFRDHLWIMFTCFLTVLLKSISKSRAGKRLCNNASSVAGQYSRT